MTTRLSFRNLNPLTTTRWMIRVTSKKNSRKKFRKKLQVMKTQPKRHLLMTPGLQNPKKTPLKGKPTILLTAAVVLTKYSKKGKAQ